MGHQTRRYHMAPLGEWKRKNPTAKRIAAALLEEPALLGLRTRALVPTIRLRFAVCESTAMAAVGMARRESGGNG